MSKKYLFLLLFFSTQSIVGQSTKDDVNDTVELSIEEHVESQDLITNFQTKPTWSSRFNQPFSSKYNFFNSALPIDKGENSGAISLFGVGFNFAITNRINASLTSSWVLTPICLTTKYNLKTKNKNLNFSLGTSFLNMGLIDFFSYGAIGFGQATFSSKKFHLTLGLGYSYFSNFSQPEIIKPGTYHYDTTTFSYNFETKKIAPNHNNGFVYSIGYYNRLSKYSAFIVDMILFHQNEQKSNYNNFQPSNYVILGSNFSAYEYMTVSEMNRNSVTNYFLILMSGIRFQKNENSCFQINFGIIKTNYTIDFWQTYEGIFAPLFSISRLYKF
jgi:hypothetical protein